jgi:hypothetical protein
MIRRWRTLVRPESAGHPASPDPFEAFGGWMLGTLCALLCLWLGDLGTHSLVPGVLVCGVIAVFGWRHLEWLFWLPTLVVVATLAEPLAPLAARGRFGALVYVDVLMLGVMVVALVRAFALRRRVMPRTPVDGLLLALCLLGVAAVIPAARRDEHLLQLKDLVIAILVFYSTVAVASRPGGARWVWPAFPLALALLGIHALWSAGLGAGLLRTQALAADAVWHSRAGMFVTLLTALPVSLGLSMDAGHRAARRVWQSACVLGAIGIALHLAAGGAFGARAVVARHGVAEWGFLAVGWVTLAVLSRAAWGLAESRPAESPRWVAVAFTCLALPLLPLAGMPSSGTTAMLLTAAGGGLVVGTRRALARDARRAEESARAAGAEAGPPAPLAEAA